MVDGVSQRVKRDLDAERVAAAKVLEALPTLRNKTPSGHDWQIPDAETALESLIESALKPPPAVEWPEGKKWVARPEVSTAA